MNKIEITSAQYVDSTNAVIKATVDNTEMFVPLDPNNRHYTEIKRQVDAGELTIQDAD
tara:strand:- start:275 stop:448 length:174 start_codon:yes stop_codon:yes gene_type:complete